MRLTAPLRTKMLRRQIKNMWKHRGVMPTPKIIGHRPLIEKGIEIEDWSFGKPEEPLERWEPPVKNDPITAVRSPPAPHERPNWHEDPAYTVYGQTRLVEGVNQACVLTKSQLFSGMPEGVSRLVGAVELPNQDQLVQQCIMLSQEWNPTQEKLPRRFDKEKIGYKFNREYGIPQHLAVDIFIRSLLLKCHSLAGRFPSVVQHRRSVRRPYLGSHYYFRGNQLINIQGYMNWMVSADQPLPIFGNEELVDESTGHVLPDIWPVAATNSVLNNHNYTIRNTTGLDETVTHSHPHVVFRQSNCRWRKRHRNALGILFSFGYCIAEARQRFGENVTKLPEPVCVQLVHMNHNRFDFIFFQLNTLNFNSDDGVKNFVWMDADNVMYNKHLPQPWKGEEYKVKRYLDYDPEVFQKLLATYLYGVPDVNVESPIVDDVHFSSSQKQEISQ